MSLKNTINIVTPPLKPAEILSIGQRELPRAGVAHALRRRTWIV